MSIVEKNFQDEQQKISDENAKVLSNFFRCLTMLEKTLERLARQRWYGKNQYPEIYFEIMSTICWLRTWATDYKVFSSSIQSVFCFLPLSISQGVLPALSPLL